MDQTELFKATVRTLRLRMRREGAPSTSMNASILPKASRKSTGFTAQAKEVAAFIKTLQEFLLKYRKDYINSAGHLIRGQSAMTDGERDQIDSEAKRFIQMSRDKINSLQEHMGDEVAGDQATLHRQAVCESLHAYLKKVTQLYSEQRAIRVKRIVDRKRISRLQPNRYRRLLGSGMSPPLETSSDNINSQSSTAVSCSTASVSTSVLSADLSEDEESITSSPITAPTSPSSPSVFTGVGDSYRAGAEAVNYGEMDPSASVLSSQPLPVDDSTALSEDERAAFALENEQLFEHMNTMVDEVRQIEGKVIEISKLQELFSEKVLEQAEQLDNIQTMTVESSENVGGGNEYVRKTIKNRASLRIWILFVLLVLSFALLFLDWYS